MFLFSCAYAYAYVACVMLIAQVGTRLKYANTPSVSPALVWEMIKRKVRGTSLYYAKQRKKERADQAAELQATLETTPEDQMA